MFGWWSPTAMPQPRGRLFVRHAKHCFVVGMGMVRRTVGCNQTGMGHIHDDIGRWSMNNFLKSKLRSPYNNL
jgi:hypothetical protein